MLRSLVLRTLRAMALGPLQTKEKRQQRPRHTLPHNERARQKQCADRNLGTKFRQRGNSLYLAFLIGRAKSTHSYAFLRLFELQPLPTPCTNNAQLHRSRVRDVHSPGGVHAFLRVQHIGRRMLFIRFVNRAVQAVRRSRPRRAAAGKRERTFPRFAAPPGDAPPRARISNFAPPQHAGRRSSAFLPSSAQRLLRRL
jgi:hypothetical protein